MAGSDSGGGAGLSADLRTFAAHGLHGAHAVTVVTAQHTAELRRAVAVDADLVVAQIEAVLDDLDVRAVKVGMLLAAPTVAAVADLAVAGRLPKLVVDPVLVDRRGDRIVADDALAAYPLLLAAASVITPNRAEAALLTGRPVGDVAAAAEAAQALAASGPAVVVTGGSGTDPGDAAVDVLVPAGGGEASPLAHDRIETVNDHGSGCTFAAAVTARLALGHDVAAAVHGAERYVAAALARSAGWRLGAGRGPLDQLDLAARRSGT